MSSILDRKFVPDAVKKEQFVQQQQDYFIRKRYLDQPVNVYGFDDPERGPTGKTPSVLQSAANSFDMNRELVSNLGAFLANVPGIEWNTLGEVSIDGQPPITGSSLRALMNDVVSQAPTRYPLGSDRFSRVLRRERIPQNLVRETSGNYRPDDGAVAADAVR